MTNANIRTALVLFLAMVASPLSNALGQRAQTSPTVKITSLLPHDETAIDRMPLPFGGIGALEHAIRYPDLARRAGLEGRVIAEITIDTVGNASNVRLCYSDASLLGEALVEGLGTVRFMPGLRRGHPVSVVLAVVANFSLRNVPNPCASDSSRIVEVEFNHYNEYDHQADRTIALRVDGSATFSGRPCVTPIDTSSVLSVSIWDPDDQVFGVIGGFNPLDFQKLCVLLNRLITEKSSATRQRIPSCVPYETITVVSADGKRKVLVDFGEDPIVWSIARTIDYIAARMQWYESWPRPDKQ